MSDGAGDWCTPGPDPTFDILITSIPHRDGLLRGLLAELDQQITIPQIRCFVYRDNLELKYGDKTRVLVETSQAEYVCCVDDDDMIAPDFMRRVMAALRKRPDFVGYPVLWTRNGVQQIRVEHSLRYAGWNGNDQLLYRDLSEKNPIRRELALLGKWEGSYAAERAWADNVRATGLACKEEWIDDPMYYYRENPDIGFLVERKPFEEPLPDLPDYDWLTVIGK